MVDRAALVRRARQRCMDLYPDCHIVSHLHVGDAPQDVQAAELGGAIALGVCVTTEHLSAWGRVGCIGAGIGEVLARWWKEARAENIPMVQYAAGRWVGGWGRRAEGGKGGRASVLISLNETESFSISFRVITFC